MRKPTVRTVALWVSLGLLWALAACSPNSQEGAQNTSPQKTLALNKIVVGVDENFPPMSFRNDKNELTGFDVEMAHEAAKRLGVPIELKPIDWIAKESALSGKQVDMLWSGLAVTEERKKSMAFTAPYLQNHQIVVVAARSPIYQRGDLAGKAVGALDGSSATEALRKEQALLVSFQAFRVLSNSQTLLDQLSQGRLEAVIMDEVVGRYHAMRQPTQYAVLEEALASEDYAVGLRPEDTALHEKMNKVLADMHKDGAIDRMALRWFGRSMAP